MRTSAIIRMVLWSFVALVLFATLIFLFNVDNILDFGFWGYSYSNESSYTKGGGEISADIDTIEVNWISGSINVSKYEGDKIIISESANKSLDDDELLRYKVVDGNLIIQYAKSSRSFNFLLNNIPSKSLELKIPASIAESLIELEIDSVSANIYLSDITSNEFNIDNVSGRTEVSNITGGNCNISSVSGSIKYNNAMLNTLDVETISGNVYFNGAAFYIDSETVSGKITMDLLNTPKEFESESVSGNVSITIPENDGFTAKYDTVSGDFNSNFSTQHSKHSVIYKNGGASFNFDSVSGDFTIDKK